MAVGLVVAALGSSASAQTVIVVKAPPGTNVEFVLNGTVAASGKVDAEGIVTLRAKQSTRQTVDASVWLDVCDSVRRVHVVSGSLEPPSEGCTRHRIAGVFVVQEITSLVMDVSGSAPTLYLRQGDAPDDWLHPRVTSDGEGPRISIAPTGLVASGAVGMAGVEGFDSQFCGDVTSCTSEQRPGWLSAGVTLWITKVVGADVSFIKPRQLTANGSGTDFRFDSDMEGAIGTFAGVVGLPIGRVRLFAAAGADYHKATFTTVQTIDPRSVTIAGVAQSIPGGTLTLQWRTSGWGLVLGGGGEVWVNDRVGIVGEFKRFQLRGEDERSSEASAALDVNALFVGVRMRIIGLRGGE